MLEDKRDLELFTQTVVVVLRDFLMVERPLEHRSPRITGDEILEWILVRDWREPIAHTVFIVKEEQHALLPHCAVFVVVRR